MAALTLTFVYTMRPQMAREAPRACTGIGNPTVSSLSASPMAATRARASYGMNGKQARSLAGGITSGRLRSLAPDAVRLAA